jgi:D-threo-aldose 1-dehydrogenase
VALGASGVRVSRLALGTAPLGNLYQPVGESDAAATVEAAFDAGLSYVDTAPHYGVGLAEQRVGAVLTRHDRASFTVSTKVGRLLVPLAPGEPSDGQGFVETPRRRRVWDFSAAGIEDSLSASCERLGLDRVDIVYLHDPDAHEREAYETAYPALAALRSRGIVGAIGVGMNQSAMLARFVRDLDLDVVLCAGRYSLLDQSALADLLPACAARGTSVVVGGVYNSGLLADPRPGATYDYERAPDALLDRARAIGEVCARFEVPLRAAALRFSLGHPVVASALVGCRTPGEVADNSAMLRRHVPGGLWRELRRRGLLADDVPTPGDS